MGFPPENLAIHFFMERIFDLWYGRFMLRRGISGGQKFQVGRKLAEDVFGEA